MKPLKVSYELDHNQTVEALKKAYQAMEPAQQWAFLDYCESLVKRYKDMIKQQNENKV